MADNSLALGLAHHADDPQQDDSPAQGDEEGEPVPAMVDVDAQRVKDQAGAECPDDHDPLPVPGATYGEPEAVQVANHDPPPVGT